MLSIHLRLGLPSGLFPSGFPTNNLYTYQTIKVHVFIITFFIILVRTSYGLFGTRLKAPTVPSAKNLPAGVESEPSPPEYEEAHDSIDRGA
jgi:hypothetical protein